MTIPPNTTAPNFTLPDQTNTEHSLSQYKGKWVLVYFYPKDDTPGCTREACDIRDRWQEFQDSGVVVLGISADSSVKHQKFSQKYKLPFTLLSDTEKDTIKTYGAWVEKNMFGKKYMGIQRCSFLIDPKGEIAKTYPKVDPKTHAEIILVDLKKLKNT